MRNRETKGDIVADLADLVGAPTPMMSTGSTEPKEIFLLINNRLGLGLDTGLRKPGLAKGIVEASGEVWAASYDSRGDTVTLEGLLAVRRAVRFFTGGT